MQVRIGAQRAAVGLGVKPEKVEITERGRGKRGEEKVVNRIVAGLVHRVDSKFLYSRRLFSIFTTSAFSVSYKYSRCEFWSKAPSGRALI